MSTALKTSNPVPDTVTVLVGGPVVRATFTCGLEVAEEYRAAEAFAAGAPQHDDMTLVVLRALT